MNRWYSELKNHPIFETLGWMQSNLIYDDIPLSEGGVTEQRRLLKVIDKYLEVLEKVDPELLPLNQLDALNNQLRNNNFLNLVNSYRKNKHVNVLIEINNQLTKNLTQLSIVSALCGGNESEIQHMSSLENFVDNAIEKLNVEKVSLEKDIDNLSLLVQKQVGELENQLVVIEKNKKEILNLLSDFVNQFTSSQEFRSQEFNKWKDSFVADKEKEFEEFFQKIVTSFREEFKQTIDELAELFEDSKSKHSSILELYHLSAGDSVGGAYLQSAVNEGKQANQWRWYSIFCILFTVFWLGFSFFSTVTPTTDLNDKIVKNESLIEPNTDKDLNQELVLKPTDLKKNSAEFIWQKFILTFSISAVLLWGGAYCAQQSTRHRNNEKKARWFALEVKAIDPFIHTLDVEQQRELKKKLADKLFGQNSTDIDNSSVLDEHFIKLVVDSVSKILSKNQK